MLIKTKNNRKMMLSRCSICNNKKSTFTAGPMAEPSALAVVLQNVFHKYLVYLIV